MIFIADNIFNSDHYAVKFTRRLPRLPFFVQLMSAMKRLFTINFYECIEMPPVSNLLEVMLYC